MALTDTKIRNVKPTAKPQKIADGEGLFLYVTPKGSKIWRFKYRYHRKEKLLTFGAYPEVSLSEAREKRLEVRKQLANGIDPSLKRREDKRMAQFDANNSFKAIALEWHAANQVQWTKAHSAKILRRLEANIFPFLGHVPVKNIKPVELLDVIRKVEKRDATELSHRVLQTCSVIFRYATATGRTEYNPAADLRGALKAHKASHYPTINAKEIPQLWHKLETVGTAEEIRLAIKILLFTFVRQGELRHAKWTDFDFKDNVWIMPAHATKMRREHIVPLSKQVIKLLQQLRKLTGRSELLLPSYQRRKNPMISENAINQVLQRMGYKGKLVGHGFRALASTTLNELGFKPDVIERQLAHKERNSVRAAYNRAEYLPERKKMMQQWADYVDSVIADTGRVVAFKNRKRVS